MPAHLLHALRRSAATSWTSRPAGPRWAPWAWTAVWALVIGLTLALLFRGRGIPLYDWLFTSLCISYAIHGLFFAFGTLMRFEMFDAPLPLRLLYTVVTSVFGTTLGYGISRLVIFGDWDRTVAHMGQAAWFFVPITVFWTLLAIAAAAFVSRYRMRQLGQERERSARASAEREAIAARLALLNAQIEPHFLYNTLAHVSALVDRDPAAARAMLDDLIAWLRASARNMALHKVPLADELDSVRGYLAVMRRRLGDRLAVRFAVPESALSVELPPATLQPLVENAIKHGIEPSPAGGTIAIEVDEGPEATTIRVIDDGAGFRAGTGGGGTGLANVRERLRLALGEAARLTLDSGEHGGAIATLRLPRSPAGATAGTPATADAPAEPGLLRAATGGALGPRT